MGKPAPPRRRRSMAAARGTPIVACRYFV